MPCTTDAILIALLVVFIVVLGYHFLMKGGSKEGFGGGQPAMFTSFTGAKVPPPYQGGDFNPYTVLNKKLGEIRGYRNDGYDQPAFYTLPQGLDTYNHAGASIKPEMIAAAERQQWYAATNLESPSDGGVHEGFTDPGQYQTPAESEDGMTHMDYITDLVVDPRTRDNHRRWVEEMQPWSGVAMKVDTLDMENYVDFRGLRRPQAVVQYNPMQLTEIDTADLAVNPKFNFR